jgi:hypothetical protein
LDWLGSRKQDNIFFKHFKYVAQCIPFRQHQFEKFVVVSLNVDLNDLQIITDFRKIFYTNGKNYCFYIQQVYFSDENLLLYSTSAFLTFPIHVIPI